MEADKEIETTSKTDTENTSTCRKGAKNPKHYCISNNYIVLLALMSKSRAKKKEKEKDSHGTIP